MKRKYLRTVLIVLGVLIFLFILIGPPAPLWAKLGVRPFCLQGEFPYLLIVSCPSAQAVITPLPIPTLSGQDPIPIIVDDDGSPDGVIALLYFLSNPQFDIRAVTISCGEAHPDVFAGQIMQMLAGLGRADIPVGAGREDPLEGTNAFPDSWRQASDKFWDVPLPQAAVTSAPVPAAELIVDIVSHSQQLVLIFISGTYTNLAEAIQLDSGIADNIKDIYSMGGSVYAPGNIHSDWPEFDNTVAEWNIWVDPVAADEVFSAELPLHLVPLDATKQVLWTQSDLPAWQASTSPKGVIASNLLEWMLNSWSPEGVYVWDLVAALQATNPAMCPEVSLSIDIITTPGPDQGRTIPMQKASNVRVCLDPDTGQMKALAASILGSR